MIKLTMIRPLIFFALGAFLITLNWFKDGLYYGGDEVGILGYNPGRLLEIQQNIWWEGIAPGMLVPQFIVGTPFYFVLSIVSSIFSTLVLQMLIFSLLIFLMGFGMYLYAVNIFGKEKKKYALLAGLFYIFNSYVLVEVWHRFLYTGIFLAAALPIFALFWHRWIKEGKLILLIIFLLTNLVFSYIYGSLPSFITVWILCFFITVSQMFLPWEGKQNFLKRGYRLTTGFLFFLITSLWFIIPIIKVSPAVLQQQHTIEANLGQLVNISKQTMLPFVLQYANPFYLFYSQELGKIYSNLIFLILPWIPIAVIGAGLFLGLKKKYFAAISIFYLITILITKAAATPFGYLYIWGFMNNFFIGVIRNPFEKLGILLPFFGCLLFILGLEHLFLFSQKKYGSFVARSLIISILFSVLMYAFPMFTGSVFNKPTHSLKVKVPQSYELANDWFKKQEERDGNILHLPFSGGDVVTYNWKHGYHGVEINEALFTYFPSITRNTGIKRIDDTLKSLTYIFTTPYSEDSQLILKTFQRFNVRFIVLHKDLNWQDELTYGEKGRLINPAEVERILNSLSFIKKEQQFGDLVIYKLTGENYKPRLSISEDVEVIYPGQAEIMQILTLNDDKKDIITDLNENNDLLQNQVINIFPGKQILYVEASDSAMISKINDVFTNQPSSAIKQLVNINNSFANAGYLQSYQLSNYLVSSTQKILSLYYQVLQDKVPPTPNQFIDYEILMRKFYQEYSQNLSIHTLFESYISDQLSMHLFILKKLGHEKSARMMEDFMVKNDLLPIFRDGNSLVFKIQVPRTDNYHLFLPVSFENKQVKIDGKKVISKDGIEIEKGQHEISISDLNQDLLTTDKVNISLKSNNSKKLLIGGEILSIKKESPVNYRGKIRFDGPSFIIFSQSYHPGWVLNLSNEKKKQEVKNHLMSNLYGNAWKIDETGVFDFNIEFTPQKNLDKGLILSVLGWIGLLLAQGFEIFKTRFSKKI